MRKILPIHLENQKTKTTKNTIIAIFHKGNGHYRGKQIDAERKKQTNKQKQVLKINKLEHLTCVRKSLNIPKYNMNPRNGHYSIKSRKMLVYVCKKCFSWP